MLDCDFFDRRGELEKISKKVLYTGQIDHFFDYRFGRLQYRTVQLDVEIIDTPNCQGNAVVNYTSADVTYALLNINTSSLSGMMSMPIPVR